MEQKHSLFDRVISKQRSIIFILGIAALLFFLFILAGILDSVLSELPQKLSWRGLLISPTIIVYILAVAPIMARMETRVLISFQAFVQLDEEEFQETISKNAKIKVGSEVAIITIGFILGIFASIASIDGHLSYINAYWVLTSSTMYALLAWTIFVSLASTRLTSALLNQPLKVDPFYTEPFEPIGKQSLMIAIVFIGGITLSLIYKVFEISSFIQPWFWIIYLPLAMVPIVLFFLNMFPTHRVLADAKSTELASVRNQLHVSCRKLLQRLETGHETTNIPAEIHALSVYEKQLNETRTWPYNTAMLRTLFFSVLIPVGTLVGRIIIEALSN